MCICGHDFSRTSYRNVGIWNNCVLATRVPPPPPSGSIRLKGYLFCHNLIIVVFYKYMQEQFFGTVSTGAIYAWCIPRVLLSVILSACCRDLDARQQKMERHHAHIPNFSKIKNKPVRGRFLDEFTKNVFFIGFQYCFHLILVYPLYTSYVIVMTLCTSGMV